MCSFTSAAAPSLASASLREFIYGNHTNIAGVGADVKKPRRKNKFRCHLCFVANQRKLGDWVSIQNQAATGDRAMSERREKTEDIRFEKKTEKVPNLIGGSFVNSKSSTFIDVINPATQQVVSQLPLTKHEEFKAAVSAAKQAFPSWRNTPITTRQRVMLKLQELIRRDMGKLAMNIATEQGKTLTDAQGDVFRGVEVVEHASGMASLQMGEFSSNVSHGIDTYSIREPLGVCAGICPFNFPAMIPLWMFPVAVTCGNTFVLKPSEKDPAASMMLAELAMEAGLPNGVLNIVHGTNDIVNAICDDEDIKAISFVVSNTAGMHIYSRASAKGKRVQGRYEIMQNNMPKVGYLGLDMIFRMCTVHVNLDFSFEVDMIRKFNAGIALQPDFMAGKLAPIPGEYPTLNDWENHLTTIFPEVRLKRYLEMRGVDGGTWRRLCALPAFWTISLRLMRSMGFH